MAAASPANAATCFAGSAEKGCISGTIRTEKDVVAGVDVNVTGPGGFDETATSDDRGRWSVEVTEVGDYTATIDEETLPANVGVTGNEGSVQVTITNLSQAKAVAFGVRTGDYSAAVSTTDRIIRSTFSGLRLGLLLALASIGLSLIYGTTGLSNFAHAELVTLGGMLGYLVVNQWGVNAWLGCALVVVGCGRVRLRPGPRHLAAAAKTRSGAGPDDDRDHRPGPVAAVHLPVLHRLRHGEDRAQRAGTPRARDRSPTTCST